MPSTETLTLVAFTTATLGTGNITTGAVLSSHYFLPSEAVYPAASSTLNGKVFTARITEGQDTELSYVTTADNGATWSRTCIRSRIAGVVSATKITIAVSAQVRFISVAEMINDFASFGGSQSKSIAQALQARQNLGLGKLGGIFKGCGTALAADVDHDVTLAAGVVADDTDTVLIVIPSAITKRGDATFAEGTGNGGMVSADSLPSDGSTYWWAIMKADGTVDMCASAASGLAPTLPTGFIYKRLVAPLKTNSSSNLRPYVQDLDLFMHNVPINDVSVNNPGTSAVSRGLTVPFGIVLEAELSVCLLQSGAGTMTLNVYSPLIADTGAGVPTAFTLSIEGASGFRTAGEVFKRTNTSAQVKTDMSASDANTFIYLTTNGYRHIQQRRP